LLAASAVEKTFGGLQALKGVSLRMEVGEIVGLIGPNGSGKTTLVNVIGGIYPAEGGSVTVDGVDVSGWSPHRIAQRRVARTFQNIRLFPNLTVVENVELAGLIAPPGRPACAVARERLREVGLEGEATRRAATLPYGAQRRVEIARALACEPRYLMLDEPAAGMNEAESDELLHTIKDLRDRYGFGILVIDHDLRLIMRLCERVVVLNDGTVISEGDPHNVQNDPRVAEAYLGRRRHQVSTNPAASDVASLEER
jgi:branched-chain amino acid transport system permease protein